MSAPVLVEVSSYLTASSMPSLARKIGELQERVRELRHVSVAYGPTPEGATDSHAWYALVVYVTEGSE